jgi:hypothetical protein
MIYFRCAGPGFPIEAVMTKGQRVQVEEVTDEKALQIAADLMRWLASRRCGEEVTRKG